MKRQPDLFEHTSQTVFSSLGPWPEISERLATLSLDKKELIYVGVISSQGRLDAILESHQYPVTGLKVIERSQDSTLFSYTRRHGEQKENTVSGRFVSVRTDAPNTYLIVCIGSSTFWKQGVLHLIRRLYPKVTFPFLSQKELYHTLMRMEEAIKPGALRILSLSSKKRLPGTARKKFQTVREWTDVDLSAEFTDAKEKNIWFSSIGFEVVKRLDDARILSTGTKAIVSKYGYFSCNGDFRRFNKTILPELVELASSKLKFFSNRDRVKRDNYSPKPLKIRYDRAIFNSPEPIRRLTNVMTKLKYGSCSVLHANPYLHVSVVDNLDFSSADLWVLSQDEILIVPELRASAAALKRIVNHVFENFREGEVTDVEEQVG